MKDVLGEGYVDALRSAYPQMQAAVDLVGYWWFRAGMKVADRRTMKAGLITTSSITQRLNRSVISDARKAGARVRWAAPDHPWASDVDGAAVRVALTVLDSAPGDARLVMVDDNANVVSVSRYPSLNDDLTAHADVAAASGVKLASNRGLCFAGLEPNGEGFILDHDSAQALIEADERNRSVVKRYVNGRDLAGRSRDCWIVDFATMSEREAKGYAQAYQIVTDRVRPHRAANRDRRRREYWWQYGRNNEELRSANAKLTRFIVTVKTSRRRFFTFIAGAVPDSKLTCISSDDAFVLGVLSSVPHLTWSLAAGARLGVGNDPTYNKESSFDPFPFPVAPRDLRSKIAAAAERIDEHRKSAIGRNDTVTMTGMYNVVEKLRSGEALTPKDRKLHELAACGVLRDLHDELDKLVAEAYGWPWPMEKEDILERLVALHDERVDEEKRGLVRWLRPDYQIPRFAPDKPEATLDLPSRASASGTEAKAERRAWPDTAVAQLAAIGALIGQRACTLDDVAGAFTGARRDLADRHLATLALMGEVTRDAGGRFTATKRVA